jgi:hypothetical protein
VFRIQVMQLGVVFNRSLPCEEEAARLFGPRDDWTRATCVTWPTIPDARPQSIAVARCIFDLLAETRSQVYAVTTRWHIGVDYGRTEAYATRASTIYWWTVKVFHRDAVVYAIFATLTTYER